MIGGGRFTGFRAALLVALCLMAAACNRRGEGRDLIPNLLNGPGLGTFRSEMELRSYLTRHRPESRGLDSSGAADTTASAESAPMPAPPPAIQSAPSAESAAAPAPAQSGQPGITNVQTAGVDEGDIVKLRRETLVILRRGRLFTVSIAGGRIRPVDQIDITPPGSTASASDYYDEMLVAGDRVVVIGYSNARRGTDIYRFRLDTAGNLTFQDAYQMRSADYYSSRNYASRLIGNELILYTPLPIGSGPDPMEALPAMRPWAGDGGGGRYRRLAQLENVYVPEMLRRSETARVSTLHTVTRCDVTAPRMECSAISVLGSASRSFYVSPDAVYVWTSHIWGPDERGARAGSLLYRLPLRPGAPTAIGVHGAPIDQFSFREDARDGMLNVLVRSEGGGDSMWNGEFSAGALALLRLPYREFGRGDREAEKNRYRMLPAPSQGYAMHNRYVGPYLLYGSSQAEGVERQDGRGVLFTAPLGGGSVTRLPLPHGVDRIEALGQDGLAVGTTAQDVYLSAIELTVGAAPKIGDRFVRHAASEAESRSHGFFYRPDPGSPDGSSGLLGLPIAKPGRPEFSSLFSQSAAIVYLRRAERRLSPLGELAADETGLVDDLCMASCNDWYGNARPIFVGDRVFALMGYELVEARVRDGGLDEVARTSFAPRGTPLPREQPYDIE